MMSIFYPIPLYIPTQHMLRDRHHQLQEQADYSTTVVASTAFDYLTLLLITGMRSSSYSIPFIRLKRVICAF